MFSSYREIAEKCITPDVQLENSAKHIEKVTADIFSVDALEKPVSVFGWQEVPRENQASDTSQRSVNMKVNQNYFFKFRLSLHCK